MCSVLTDSEFRSFLLIIVYCFGLVQCLCVSISFVRFIRRSVSEEMARYILASILLTLSMYFEDTLSTECVETTKPTTRTFPSIVSYQGNKIPFDPRNSSAGNYVAFNFKQIDNLPKNTFLTFDSEHILQLDLSEKSIEKIDDGAFLSLICLKHLVLKNNTLTKLTWKVFDGLLNLQTLELNGNKLKEIPAMAFATLDRLDYLDLSDNLLRKLSPFSFSNMTSLTTLILKNNYLAYIAPEVFTPLLGLHSLDLSYNKLTDADIAYKWELTSLSILNLSGNFFRSFDTTLNYTFTHLLNLNLSSNYLTDLNSYALKDCFQDLNVLDLNQNYWSCANLAKIVHYLADSRIRLPSRNKTNITEQGIDCDNTNNLFTYDFEETTVKTSSTPPVTTPLPKLNEVKIVTQITDLSVKNDKILLEISGVRKLLIFSLLFFALFVILYASFQIGVCDGLKRKFSRREGYIDTSIQNNYSMLRP